MPNGSSDVGAAALDILERVAGTNLFRQLFGILITDNSAEFSDPAAIERTALGGGPRCRGVLLRPAAVPAEGRL